MTDSDRALTRDAAGPFDPPGIVWSGVSPRLITARLLSTAITLAVLAVPVVVLAILFPHWWQWLVLGVLALIGLWTVLLVPRQVRAIGYAERDDDLLIRKGIMFRSLVVVPYGRMQYVDVQAGPLARRLRIAQIQLHTASASTDAMIDGLEPAEADRLRDRLASRGEARLAGL
ncbi:PH domain-containing protein [Cellulosimicrobium sp. Marseille-Q4280]|uniref:PH domain-containing protein n=1 Tax=Cellulosimicrobium sp. Marseille-Q4280 TaxID=2937992 RepID=UPI00204173D5|nr:PH domain-containing protein [Cellulosimicrobium sp. Marseille-Q4280]